MTDQPHPLDPGTCRSCGAGERWAASEARVTGPWRVQRSRAKGERLPDGAICVTRPGKWGNPFVIERRDDWYDGEAWLVVDSRDRTVLSHFSSCPNGRREAAAVAVEEYRCALVAGDLRVTVEDVRRDLSGKTLACWCPVGAPCHADVLLELANAEALE